MVSVMTDARQRVIFDLKRQSVRELNQFLHGDLGGIQEVLVENPDRARPWWCTATPAPASPRT